MQQRLTYQQLNFGTLSREPIDLFSVHGCALLIFLKLL